MRAKFLYFRQHIYFERSIKLPWTTQNAWLTSCGQNILMDGKKERKRKELVVGFIDVNSLS